MFLLEEEVLHSILIE